MNLLRQLRSLFRKEKLDAEMSDEMRAHLELQTAENENRGLRADEARYAAQRQFGGVEQIKERARDARGFVWVEHLLQDLRYAVRALRKSPAFTAVAVASLAIGIGANVAMFGWFADMVFRPLPVAKPGELVLLGWHRTGVKGDPSQGDGGEIDPGDMDAASGQRARRVFSWPAFERLRIAASPLAELLAMAPLENPNVTIDGQPERLSSGNLVSGNFHTVLGVRAAVGRTLRPEDDQAGAAPVVVISHRYWQRRFAGDPGVVGKSILLNRVPVTIIGVTAAGFGGVIAGTSVPITAPLALTEQIYPEADQMALLGAGRWWMRIMGRLKPGVASDQMRAGLEGVFREVAALGWNAPDAPPRLLASAGGYGRSEKSRHANATGLLPLVIMVALLLVVACANLANLLLARGAARRRELAVRLALGASRARLVRQLFTESMLLALLGSVAGVLVAIWDLDLLISNLLPPWEDAGDFALRIDWRVAGFSAALALLTAAVFGLVPAWRATRLDLTTEFQGGSRTLGGGARSKLSRGLMIAQVAFSLVLLVLAGLFGRTVRNLLAVDIGFNRERLLLFSVSGVTAGYEDSAQLAALYGRVAEQIATLGGVRGVTYSGSAVLSRDSGESSMFQRLDTGVSVAASDMLRLNQVEATFFDVYGMSFVLGRGFTRLDDAAKAPVVVMNQALAAKYFPGENPLGHRIRVGRGRNQRDAEIVGVVRDFRQKDLRSAPLPMIYTPTGQRPLREVNFAVRTSGAPETLAATVRKTVAQIDPNLPLANLRFQTR
ncbi:MAG: ADOP family duplicated permease [Opitutaceae bacterium]